MNKKLYFNDFAPPGELPFGLNVSMLSKLTGLALNFVALDMRSSDTGNKLPSLDGPGAIIDLSFSVVVVKFLPNAPGERRDPGARVESGFHSLNLPGYPV
uniref:Uncharacterized protein n=1 Tax=Romanomermis culicivorax TaxID=13658 RepID=A0A915LAL2_ROMCU